MTPRRNFNYRGPPNGQQEGVADSSPLSLFNFFLQHGRAPTRRDIMNSLVINPDQVHSSHHQHSLFSNRIQGSEHSSRNTHPTVKFQYHVPNTNLVVDKSINVLEDPETQDVATWIEDLKQTAHLCGWDELGIYNALRALLHKDLFEIVQSCESSQEAFKQLILFFYPELDGNRFYRQLLGVRQNQFSTISEYVKEIKKLIGRLAISNFWSHEFKEQQLQQTFKQGLGINTQIELVKLNITQIYQIVSHIEAVENILISEIQNFKENPTHYSTSQQYSRHRSNRKQRKWCAVHHVNTHHTSECRALTNSQEKKFYRHQNDYNIPRRMNNNNTRTNYFSQKGTEKNYRTSENRQSNANSNNQVYAIKEPDTNINKILLSGAIGNAPMKFLIDTGAQLNIITRRVISEYDAETRKMPTSTLELANGSKIDSKEEITLEFTIDDIPDVTFKSEFLIIESSSFEAILGMKFLCANNAIINLKEPMLVIKNHEIELGSPAAKQWIKFPDKQLCEKTKVFTVQSPEQITKQKIRKLTKKIQVKQPKIGTIGTYQHHIHLLDNRPVTSKPYPVPVKILEQVKTTIKDLIAENIIRQSDSRYCAPAFPILKQNGSIRIVVDYRV